MTTDNANNFAAAMMGLTDLVLPMHEWLMGEYNYFIGQGYTEEQARCMAAAEYTTAFGQKLPNWEAPPDE